MAAGSKSRGVKLTTEQALYLRMRGQGLLPQHSRVSGADATAEVVRFTGGLQAQDLFAATLGVRVRTTRSTSTVSLADFERSRLDDRTVTWTWLMRGTLHVVPSEDLDWLLAVLGPQLIAATARRRSELGLTPEVYAKGLAVVLDKLAECGPSTREELSDALAQAGRPNGYSIERYLLFCAALEGRICFGPDRGDAPGVHPTFTLLNDWLGRAMAPLTDDERRAAEARLTRRYLDAFAPASLADFSTWSGVNVRDLRAGWDAVSRDLLEVRVGEQALYVPEERMGELDDMEDGLVVRLLPAFDTYILGHRTRDLIDDGRYAARIKGGGMLPASVLVNGRLGGTWRTNRKGRRIAVTVEPFEAFSPEVEGAVKAELADIDRFVGG